MKSHQRKERCYLAKLLKLITGFLLAMYGFSAFVAPENYPIPGIPSEHSYVSGLVLPGLGMYLIMVRRKGGINRILDGDRLRKKSPACSGTKYGAKEIYTTTKS